MIPRKIIKYGITVIAVGFIIYVLNFAVQFAYIGSIYDAKTVCSCKFVSGRDFETIKAEELYTVPFANNKVD